MFKTFINVSHSEELTEILNWLLFLGENIKVREVPKELLKGLQERYAYSAHRQCQLPYIFAYLEKIKFSEYWKYHKRVIAFLLSALFFIEFLINCAKGVIDYTSRCSFLICVIGL